MKLVYLLPLSASAGLGIFINGSYYYSAFMMAGYGPFFSFWLSVSFMLMESILWLYKTGITGNILKVVILFFSVSMTLGAQFFSTSELESRTEEKILSATGNGDRIEYLKKQIEKEDDRIDSIFREREEKTIYTLSSEPLETAQENKKRYEAELSELLSERTVAVEKINSPKTLYGWIAYELPEILRSGISENLIRVVYQLISSALLALMAPISLSMIRMSISKGKPEIVKPEATEAAKSDDSDRHKKKIADMILYHYPERGFIAPEKASEYFGNMNKGNSSIPHYTVEECRAVYDEIIKHDGKTKNEIRKEILNV